MMLRNAVIIAVTENCCFGFTRVSYMYICKHRNTLETEERTINKVAVNRPPSPLPWNQVSTTYAKCVRCIDYHEHKVARTTSPEQQPQNDFKLCLGKVLQTTRICRPIRYAQCYFVTQMIVCRARLTVQIDFPLDTEAYRKRAVHSRVPCSSPGQRQNFQ